MALRVITELREPVAIVRLASPERGNAFGPDDHFTLCDALAALEARHDVRSIVITGEGSLFSAGADVAALGAIDPTRLEEAMLKSLAAVEATFDASRVAIIGVINGPCVGGAVGLALKCDVLIAAASARFSFPFAKLGLLPDSGLTYLLPRLIGESRARALFMTGADIDAHEAKALGLVVDVCPNETLEAEAIKLAERCAKLPPGTAHTIRRALIRSRGATLNEQLAFEAAMQAKAVTADGFKERLAAALKPKR